MVRGSVKRIEQDDPYSAAGRKSLQRSNHKSPDTNKASTVHEPETSNKASYRIMEVKEVLSEEESAKGGN